MYILCTRCSLLTPWEPRGLEIGYSFRLHIASCVRRIKYTTRSWDGKMGGGGGGGRGGANECHSART